MLDIFSASGFLVHSPCGPRKSGMPESVEMPAPVRATTRDAAAIHSRTRVMRSFMLERSYGRSDRSGDTSLPRHRVSFRRHPVSAARCAFRRRTRYRIGMRVAILGSGAVGGFYGAALARAGHDVVFVARGDHLRAIRERGLEIVSSAVGNFVVHAAAEEDTRRIGHADCVI